MKKTMAKVVLAAMLLSVLASLFSGCSLKNKAVDGPGMVNYPGILLNELVGDWFSIDDVSYEMTFWDDYTISMSRDDVPLLDEAVLTLYTDSANPDEYAEFDVRPNAFTDGAGNSVKITKAGHENGTVTLELSSSDGTKSTLQFIRVPELLDGPGMVYYGGYLDEAITGCWQSADGRFVLDFDGKYADFYADGKQLVSKDCGYFIDHSFSEGDDLNERCELFPMGVFLDEFETPPLDITEMWYQAEHIYMNVAWPDGKAEEIVFSKAEETAPEELPDGAESEAAPDSEAPDK